MKKRYLLALTFPLAYCVGVLIFVFNSGVGHDWGTGALVILSLPPGGISLIMESLFPKFGLITLLPLFGFLQYIFIGYFVGRWLDKRPID